MLLIAVPPGTILDESSTPLSIPQLIDRMIKEGYDPKKHDKIELNVCNASTDPDGPGPDESLTQKLADALGKPVSGPNNLCHRSCHPWFPSLTHRKWVAGGGTFVTNYPRVVSPATPAP